jgi:hypothetical protein
MPNSHEATVRFYVTDGPLATSVSEASNTYFHEGLHAGRGGVRVILRDGTVELIAGSRYLAPGTHLRAEVVGARLQIVYLGTVIREYHEWLAYSNQLSLEEFPPGNR